MALSGDGHTALIGAPSAGSDNADGAAYLYSQDAQGAWPGEPTADFAGPSASRDHLGDSVALSGDGGTALIGAPGVNSFDGAAYLYTAAPSGSWSAGSALVVTFPGIPGSAGDLGVSVALSSDGQTALAGAPTTGPAGTTGEPGAAYVYTGSAGWSTYTTATFLGTTAGASELGWSAALSADGQVALVGTFVPGGAGGAADLYTALSGWSGTPAATFASKGQNGLGFSAALSADGQDALIGAPGAGSAGYAGETDGAAYLYTPSTTTTTTLTASPSPPTAGQAVTLTAAVTAADGSTPAGTVTFMDSGTVIGSPATVSGGTASTTTTFAAAGPESLSAVFTPTGKASYSSSTGLLALTVQAAETTAGNLRLAATVPPLGSFTLTVAPGTVTLDVSGGTAAGTLNTITVTDTRNTYPGWSVSGQVADFTGSGSAAGASLAGNQLGWQPTATSLATGVVLGPAVLAASPGLGGTAAILASAAPGGGVGTSLLGADLTLAIPATTPAGPYAGALTVTAVS